MSKNSMEISLEQNKREYIRNETKQKKFGMNPFFFFFKTI